MIEYSALDKAPLQYNVGEKITEYKEDRKF